MNLHDSIKLVQFCTHNRWFIGDVWFWESIKSRTIYTFSWTSPKLCEEGNNRNSRLTSDSTFSEYFCKSQIFWEFSCCCEFVVSFYQLYTGNRFVYFMFSIDFVFYFMEIISIECVYVFESCYKYLIDDRRSLDWFFSDGVDMVFSHGVW